MKKLVYCSQMEEIDKETQKTMISMLLIEQAALRMWFLCKEKIPSLSKDTRIVFLCGGGNNGSDALAAARSASVEGYRNISCIVLPRGNEIHMMEQFFISNYPAHLVKPEDALPVIGEADVIFEGLCGTGLKSALTGTAKVLVEAANGNTHVSRCRCCLSKAPVPQKALSMGKTGIWRRIPLKRTVQPSPRSFPTMKNGGR